LSRPFMLMLRSTLPLPQRVYPDRVSCPCATGWPMVQQRHENNSHDHQNNSHEEQFPRLRDGTIVSGIALIDGLVGKAFDVRPTGTSYSNGATTRGSNHLFSSVQEDRNAPNW